MKRKWIVRLFICLLLCAAGAGAGMADEIYTETPLDSASTAQRWNIELAAQLIDGTQIGFGEAFSFNTIVGERSTDRGFVGAPNGRGINVVGGGVAQTATTLYLALMQRDDIEYSSIYTYNERFIGDYVSSGYDAIATDYKNNLDFAFNSYYEGTLRISMWIAEDRLCCYLSEDGGRWTDGWCEGYAQTPALVTPEQEANIRRSAMSIDGWEMRQGDVFLFNEIVGARTAENGYQAAINGRGVKVYGGGTAQVAATLYLAIRDMPNVQIIEKRSYGDRFTGTYVENGEDAVLVDYANGLDFSFIYWGEDPITIYTYMLGDWVICEVYSELGGE